MPRTPTTQDAERYHAALTRVVDRLSTDLGLIAFRKQNGQQVVLACLYSTILQSTRECLMLMSKPTLTLPSVLRTITEAYADLRALIIDGDHAQRMIATFLAGKRRNLRSMISSTDNPFHRDVAQHLDPTIELPKVEQKLMDLEALGHRPMSNRDRFERAQLATNTRYSIGCFVSRVTIL